MKEWKPTLHFLYAFALELVGWLTNKINMILKMRILYLHRVVALNQLERNLIGTKVVFAPSL